MAVVKIKDAPFKQKVKKYLLAIGIEEADWGHPEVVLKNPIKYFKERVRLNDDPSLVRAAPRKNLPYLRGTNLRDDYRKTVVLGTAQVARPLRVSKTVI